LSRHAGILRTGRLEAIAFLALPSTLLTQRSPGAPATAVPRAGAGSRALRCGGFAQTWFDREHATARAMRAVFRAAFGLGKGRQLSATHCRRGVAGDAQREAD
jgi:hypothetical protein